MAPVELEDPLAQEFISWRSECESAIWSTFQRLSRGIPNLENETWNASVAVIKGLERPEGAGARLQAGLEKWYVPHQWPRACNHICTDPFVWAGAKGDLDLH